MAVFSKQNLLTELLDRIELAKASTQPFLRLTDDQLNFRPGPAKWSITQIFGHLNITHDIYIRRILTKITMAPDVKSQDYNSSWLGDWVYEKMMPRADGSVFRLRARKSNCLAAHEQNGKEVLHKFLQQCDALDDILRHASTKDLQRIKIPFSFTSLLQLRLGDNLRYLIAHNERHLLQAHRVMTLLP
ncbi:MAG: DinB family protein [Bacteroidota bacterium]